MNGHSRRGVLDAAVAGGALLVAVVLAGCADTGSGPHGPSRQEKPTVDEARGHSEKVCPARLPRGQQGHQGLVANEPAQSAPSLPSPESAWVCRYDPADAFTGAEGRGTTWAWQRARKAAPVDPSDLPTLARYLSRLMPADAQRVCTADLGPRWMLVYAHGQVLTGVVVDDYGCQDVRLTDDPFETPPGEATRPGTVSGVLTAPRGFLDQLKSVPKP